jgi:co-chaperonin GroES (HSP10)
MLELDFDPTSPDVKLRAVNDFVVVRQYKPPMKGSIIVPGTNPLQDNTGVVLSVGPDAEKAGVQVGDVVVWQVFKGQAVGHFDKERWFLKREDICGVVERPAK